MDLLPAVVSRTCTICGSSGAQIHYRAVACGSCKIFFIRTLRRSMRYLCEFNGECTVTKETRNSCKACRFTKCLQANMTEQDVGRFKKNSAPSMDESSSVVPYVADHGVMLAELADSTSIGIHFANDLEKALCAPDVAKTLVTIERLCDNATSSRSQFDYSLDISLAEVLGKPHLCCARTPIGWGEDEYTGQSILEILKQVYCRTVTHFADFVTSCPELSLLEERDRLSLCSTNYCGIVLLMLVYNAYERGCDGILFPHGFKYSLSKSHRREDHEFNEFLHELVEYLHRNVAQTFRAINITVEEYSILKTILLFSGVITLTDAGTETVHRARRKYTSLLSEYVMMTRSDLSSEEKMERLAKLFDIIPLMLHASERDNVYCARMVLMNTGNLEGTLSFDMHIRKF